MAQEETKRVTKRREVEEQKALTLLDAVEQIAEQAQNSALSEAFFKKVAKPINYIVERLQISDKQAMMLALLANFYDEWNTLSELTEYLGCKRLHLLRYAPELEFLRKNQYIRIRASNNSAPAIFKGEAYQITNDALHAIKHNETFNRPTYSGLTIREFFDRLNDLTEQRKNEGLEYSLFAEEVFELINANSTLPFVGKLKSLNLPEEDLILFLWGCDMLVSENDGVIIPRDIDALYNDMRGLCRRQLSALREQQSLLFDRGLLQPVNNDGMGRNDAYELTSYVRNEFLQGLGVKPSKQDDSRLLSCKSIVAKELFYNPKEERSLTQLSALLEPEQFDNICARLEEKGLRRGFASLFYGAPGTGKTETVLQLARKTGRDLMQVNVSEIKSMWVGESEKNIKALFDRYRRLVKKSDRAPILFFNEADAIFGKRIENVDSSANQMINTIQNIILQEMETIDGIMICTTNLHSNLDLAFERRFIYKIELEKPDETVRNKIWKSMMNGFNEEEYSTVSRKYPFSGGQIENIVRKSTVDYILSGKKASLETICKFCDEETFKSKVRRVGF
jgi:hypothetical protein